MAKSSRVGARRWRLEEPWPVVLVGRSHCACQVGLRSGFARRTGPDFAGLAAGLCTFSYRRLKLDGQSQKEDRKAALTAALGGVWHEERAHAAFQVGDICVRCAEAVENLEHIVHHCPRWNKERRESGLPAHALEAPGAGSPGVRLHGLLLAPPPGAVPTHEPALVMRLGVHTVWTDGSGRHSSNPHFCRCGVGYVTSLTLVNMPGSRCLAGGNPLEWKSATPRELSVIAKATRQVVDDVRITIEDFQGNQEAEAVANLGAAAHEAHGPGGQTLLAFDWTQAQRLT
eukprot:165722-Amphidinium_carterae.2